MSRATPADRLVFLDGLRGLAILLVFCFHAFSRWPKLVPYGNAYGDIALFEYGYFGVPLFFMISGFVILMTLEKCAGFTEFMLRRWLRLFPAMLIASIMLFATAPLFPERPGGMPTPRDLIPGLTLIDPTVWMYLLRGHQGVLELSFWSLFAEIKFYVVFGAAYFLWGRTRAIVTIFACFARSTVADGYLAHQHLSYSRADLALQHLNDLSDFQYFGWFAAGCWFYEYYLDRSAAKLCTALCSAMLAALLLGQMAHFDIGRPLAGVATVAIFVLPLLSRLAARVAAARILLTFGFVSYPFYLFHEKLTISLLIKSGTLMRWVPGWLLGTIPLLCVFAIAWLVATFGEPWVRSLLRPPVGYICSTLTRFRQPKAAAN